MVPDDTAVGADVDGCAVQRPAASAV